MADNRIYAVCIWCEERNPKGHNRCTLARYGVGNGWDAAADKWPAFVKEHMHTDEDGWWTSKNEYNPFRFEYEDTNEQETQRHKEVDLMMKLARSEEGNNGMGEAPGI
jgi:hypothetical protein